MISIICPSRNRPNELLETLKSFELDKYGLEALVWLDNDDPQLDKYKELFGSNPNVRLFIKERVGYINFHMMVNFLASEAKFDWLLLFNDDAYMDNPKWFDIFRNFVSGYEPDNQTIVINIWEDPNINSFPIVSRKTVDLLGHFSLLPICDNWMNLVAFGANIIYRLDGIKPKHRKYEGENTLVDGTLNEVENDKQQMRDRRLDPRSSPYRQLVRQDIANIVNYNNSPESCMDSKSIKTVGFIGLGKLGLPVAETIAKRGFNVIGYDIRKVETELPITSSVKYLVEKSDILFCAVQTPHDPRFEGDKPLPRERADFDYSYLIKVINDVVSLNKKINLVVISTCLPGTYKNTLKPLLGDKINYIYNPFFIAMGTVVEDFLNPEFVLIGGEDIGIIKHFYSKFFGRDRTLITDITTAEGIKVFYNTFVTTKTVLGNMYGEYAHKLGMNVDDIYKALSSATDRLISPKYLKSGMADGGGCHPRDNIALSYLAEKAGLSYNYFDALMTAREKHTEWLADIFIEEIVKNKISGVILGKSFKPETDLQLGSAAILLANILKGKKIIFQHYEFDYPKLSPAVYFIATQHSVYTTLNFPPGSVVIDPFRYISDQKDVKIIRIGNP